MKPETKINSCRRIYSHDPSIVLAGIYFCGQIKTRNSADAEARENATAENKIKLTNGNNNICMHLVGVFMTNTPEINVKLLTS